MIEKKINYNELKNARCKDKNLYDYYKSYCSLMSCCEECNSKIRFWCKVIDKIRDIQKKYILKICK